MAARLRAAAAAVARATRPALLHSVRARFHFLPALAVVRALATPSLVSAVYRLGAVARLLLLLLLVGLTCRRKSG